MERCLGTHGGVPSRIAVAWERVRLAGKPSVAAYTNCQKTPGEKFVAARAPQPVCEAHALPESGRNAPSDREKIATASPKAPRWVRKARQSVQPLLLLEAWPLESRIEQAPLRASARSQGPVE